MSKTILIKLWSKNARLCRKYKKQPKPRRKHLEIGCFLVEVTRFELATSTSRTLTSRFFPYFTRLFGAFKSKNDAFQGSCKHCFHVVRDARWSKVWSSPFRWDMDAIRKSKIRLRKNSFSAVIIPYISTIVCYSSVVHDELNAIYRIRIAVCKRLLSTLKICIAVVKEKLREKR